jgi:hypothetical protein
MWDIDKRKEVSGGEMSVAEERWGCKSNGLRKK